MFTHKQAWRRQRHSRSSERTIRFEASQLHESMNRSQSLPNFSAHAKKSLDYSTPRYHTMGNLSSKESKSKVNNDNKMKKVKFSDKSKVVLIPSRGEYAKHGLASDIWWGVEDYVYFKASARLEVMDLLDKYNGNIQCALTALYQPDDQDNESSSPPPDGISTAPSPCDIPESNLSCSVVITNSRSSSDLVHETSQLRITANNDKHGEEDLPSAHQSCLRHPANQSIKPSDLFSSVPPCGTRAPRDSLRNKISFPPPAPKQSSKAVHPLALIMT